MNRSDFNYELPTELIAQKPLPERGASRLLVLDGNNGERQDRTFSALPDLLRNDDLLILNNTRVIPARLVGRKETGGKVEVLIERLTGASSALAKVRASKSPQDGSELLLPGDAVARIESRVGEFFAISLDRDLEPYLSEFGEVPLPPYISRAPTPADTDRYQTVFAEKPGAVAAPTAGLHFDTGLLQDLQGQGVDHAFITLHVGAGTFSPVRTTRVEDHRLHGERLTVTQDLCDRIERTRAAGGRVIAVGTTSVRALESAAAGGALTPIDAETDLYIYPGYQFQVVDALVTNFHLPESSLLMLVAALAGREAVLAAYAHAVAKRYRFFSYGDAMFVTRAKDGL
ncbi:MAG: tRNA preQ1(34) S-adenosylmethionine ribosyltransferase-isomerase QueA [Candidatus Rariloculaceae bacterium]